MADGEGTSLTSSPGARLAVARKQAGLSTSEAAERLHLNQQTLEALEAGRLEGLGAAVYVRGHLKRYAELVGVPESEILAAYDAWSGRFSAQPDLREVITAPAIRSGTRRFELKPAHAVIGAIVLVLVMVVWWAMRKPLRVAASAAAPAVKLQPVEAPSSQPPDAVPTEPAPPQVPIVAASAPAKPAAIASAKPEPAKPPAAASAAAAPATLPAAVGAAQVRLALNFSQNSWIDIYGADGAQLFHGMAQSGSQHHVTGSAPLRVFLGNPPGVTLELNGHPVDMTGNPKPRRFTLDEAGHIAEVRAEPPAKGSAAQPRSD